MIQKTRRQDAPAAPERMAERKEDMHPKANHLTRRKGTVSLHSSMDNLRSRTVSLPNSTDSHPSSTARVSHTDSNRSHMAQGPSNMGSHPSNTVKERRDLATDSNLGSIHHSREVTRPSRGGIIPINGTDPTAAGSV